MNRIDDCTDGSCAMCRAERTWTPKDKDGPHPLESAAMGVIFGLSAWVAVWACWQIGSYIGRHGYGWPTLIATASAGAVAGLWAATTGRRR